MWCKLKRFFRKTKKKFPAIQIRKQLSAKPEIDRVDIVITRRCMADGRPYNTVCLLGNVSEILFELFDLKGAHLEPSELGKKYGAELTKTSFKINITQPFPLRELCEDLHIRRIILIRVYIPSVNNNTNF